MPKRGRKKKIKLKIRSDSIKSISAVLLIVGGAVSFVSFFVPDYAINSKLQAALRGLFGYSSILVPVVLVIWGLLYIRSVKWRFADIRVLFGIVGLLFTVSAFSHIFYSGNRAYEIAHDGAGGGLIGYKISQILVDMVSVYGGILLLLAASVIALIFILDLSLDEILAFVGKYLGKFNLGKLKFSRRAAKEEEIETKENKSTDKELKIKSGTEVLDKDTWEDADEEILEPSFEIVPSMAEPQIITQLLGDDANGDLVSIAPNLPYTDKVWEHPPLDLLIEPTNTPVDRGDVKARVKIIEDTLTSFGVSVKVVEVNFGPSVTQYALEAESGTKIAKISSLQYDLALALASPTGSVRIEAPIPGRSLIGVEVPNISPVIVNFKTMLTSDAMKGMKSKLGVVLGLDVGGQPHVTTIAKMPHILVAGATGSGKSVFLHSLIFSLLYRCAPTECKFIFIDPKRVELVHYRDIPHLLTPVVTETDKAAVSFRWAVAEMERRYKLFESAKARNIEGYNEMSGFQALPYIVIVVDELAEIMVADPAAVEKSIIRLAQLARATGIHLILTVQRPSTNVITGLIKANIPCRVAFNVTSQIDSRVIIDQPGAEKLLGKGDMLFVPPDASKPIRIQGAFVDDKEINSLVAYLKSAGGTPDYNEDVFTASTKSKSVSAGGESTDDLFAEAIEVVASAGKASASLLQRRLSIGYARAARILDELEAEGVVGPAKGSKPRDVFAKRESNPLIDDTINTAF